MALCSSCLLLWAVIAFATYLLYKKFAKKSTNNEIRKKDWKRDTVYFYQFNRRPGMASMSPFCAKIEMFLRIHNIPYENCFICSERSKYGLVPFIELNGVQYADSQLLMEKLKEHFKIKPLASPRDEAFARSLERMVDNHTFPIMAKYKILDNLDAFLNTARSVIPVPDFLIPVIMPLAKAFFKRKIENRVYTMLGPFSDDEFHFLLKKDLNAIRDVLGENKYLMGDKLTTVDCAVFGQLSTMCYMRIPTEVQRIVKEEYPTIQSYIERVVEEVFPKEFYM